MLMPKYNTDQRKKLLFFLKNNMHTSFSAQTIYQALIHEHISLSAIYRNLRSMEQEGLLCKTSGKNRLETLYQYLDPIECSGIIHLKCQSCEATFHLNRLTSQMLTDAAKEELAFDINHSIPFLYGKCNACSQQEIKTLKVR